MSFDHGIRWTKSTPKKPPVERLLYERGDVRITDLLATFGENIYSIWTVASASRRKRLSESWIPLVVILLAAFFVGEGWDNGVEQAMDDGIKWSLVMLGLLLAGYGLYFNEQTKPDYIIQLRLPEGEVQVYTSTSQEETAKIIDALNQAIAEKDNHY
jgi:hypothetical protein